MSVKYDVSVFVAARHNTNRRCADKCIIVLSKKKKKKGRGVNTLLGRDPSRTHTPTHVCPCLHQRTFLCTNIQMCTHTHTPAVISVEAHGRSLTTMRTHICASGTDTALWIWVALQDNNGRKKLSSRIRGITTKSTTAARINRTEQDLSPSRSEVQTVRQTDTNLLAFRSPTQFC